MDAVSSNLLRFIIHPCLAITPFLVLFVVKGYTYSPYVAARSIAFRVITEALLVAWVILAVREPRFRPRKNPLFIGFAAFLVIQLTAALFGEDFGKSFWGTLLRMEGIVTYLHLFVYTVILASVLNTREAWKLHLNLHVCAGILLALISLVEWSVGEQGYRIESLLGNALYVATYSYFLIFISLLLLVQLEDDSPHSRIFRAVYFASIVMHLLVIFLSGTRGAMLGLVVALVTMAVLALVLLKKDPMIRRISVLSLALIAVSAITLVALRDTAVMKSIPTLARVAAATTSSTPAKIRMASWKAAIEGAKERPLRGWGAENFHVVMSKYFDPFLHDQSQWYDRAHNVFLDWLVGAGIPGLLSYIFLLVSLFWLIWKGSHGLSGELKIILTGLFAGYLTQEFFAFDSVMSLILWATLTALVAATPGENPQTKGKSNRQLWMKVLAGYLLCTISVSYLLNYPIARNSVMLGIARWYRSPEGPSGNLEMFKELLNYKTSAQPEIIEELFNFVTTGVNWNAASPQKRAEYFGLLMREFDAEIARRPSDPRILWFAARTRIEMGDYSQAVVFMRQAKLLAPKMPIILSTLAQAHFLNNDYLSTERELENLYILAPANPTAKAAYAQILRLNGKNAEAEIISRK